MKPIPMHAIPCNSANIHLLPFFKIIEQLRAMKWRKWKQPLHAIPRNGIPIGNPIQRSLIFGDQMI